MNILIGSVGISDYFGCVSPVYYVFRETPEADLRFINYVFNTREFQKELRKYANGILEIRLRVSASDIFKRKIPLPGKNTQKAIADFLDAKCAEIDALTVDIQTQIDTLEQYKHSVITEAVTKGLNPDVEMKDSGSRWCPLIPIHWELVPAKYLFHNSDLRKQNGDEQLTASQKYGIITQRAYMKLENTSIVLANKGVENWKHVEPNDFIISLRSFQGLYREYINRQEELPVMRGKINLPGTIKNRLARKQLLTCDYDELSENNLLNQIIKTVVMLLLRNAKVKAEYKDDLKKKMLFFSDVDTLEPTSIRWSSIRFQRNNQTYRMLISICQLIIEGMLITTDAGEYRLASFVDEQRMCRLYEKFILEYYSKHFPELSVSASQIPWSVDDGIRTMLPVMQSDIHLQKGNTVLIIDAKYYSHTTQTQYDKHTLHALKAHFTGEVFVCNCIHDACDVVDHHKCEQCVKQTVTATEEVAKPSSDSCKCKLNRVPEFLHNVCPPLNFGYEKSTS